MNSISLQPLNSEQPNSTQHLRLDGHADLFHQPCCCGGDPDEACGYPPKTVRAIISITIVLLSFITFVFLAIFLAIKEQYTEAMGIAGIISSVLSGVIGYYFGSKQAKPPHQLPEIPISSENTTIPSSPNNSAEQIESENPIETDQIDHS